LPACFDQAL